MPESNAWSKGEASFNVSPSATTAISWPILILMGVLLIVILVVYWRSSRKKK